MDFMDIALHFHATSFIGNDVTFSLFSWREKVFSDHEIHEKHESWERGMGNGNVANVIVLPI
jgi:hypothetical protein